MAIKTKFSTSNQFNKREVSQSIMENVSQKMFDRITCGQEINVIIRGARIVCFNTRNRDWCDICLIEIDLCARIMADILEMNGRIHIMHVPKIGSTHAQKKANNVFFSCSVSYNDIPGSVRHVKPETNYRSEKCHVYPSSTHAEVSYLNPKDAGYIISQRMRNFYSIKMQQQPAVWSP